MPKLRATSEPKLRKQKRKSGAALAFVELSGVRYYCGEWGTPEAIADYRRHVSEWRARGSVPDLPPPPICTVVEAADAYLAHCEAYYMNSPPQSIEAVIVSLQALCALYGREPIAKLSGLHIKAFRESLINQRRKSDPTRPALNITTINKRIGAVRRMVQYAVSIDLCPPEVLTKVSAVENLKPGRCAAPPPKKIKPVPLADIEATRPHLNRTLRALVDLQLACGARPGELVALRRCDIQQVAPDLWEARLEKHKTAHMGRDRVLMFGPMSIAVLRPVLLRTARDGYLFPAREGMLPRIEEAHCHRRPDQMPNTKKTDREVGPHYSVVSYRRAMQRICDEHRITRWSPNQLRHNFATEARRRDSLESARLLLGHSDARITDEVYAERDLEAARELARKLS